MSVRIGGLVAAALVILGSFLPWATLDAFGAHETVNGMDGDGVITLLVGIAMAALFAIGKRGTLTAAAVVSLVAAGIGAFELVDVQSVIDEFGFLVSGGPGVGLFLIVAGGIAGLVLGVLGQRRADTAPGVAAGYAAPWGQAPVVQTPQWGQAPQPQSAGQTQWGPAPQGQAPAWGQAQAAAPQPVPQVAPQPQSAGQPPAGTPAGWLADPYRQAQLRYWDGTRWTEHTHNQPQG